MAKKTDKKDADAQRATTKRNKDRRAKQAERKLTKLIARTQSLVGQHVEIRIKGNVRPMVGTVFEILRKDHDEYPHSAKRHSGAYLKVRTSIGDHVVSRHRVKPIREEH